MEPIVMMNNHSEYIHIYPHCIIIIWLVVFRHSEKWWSECISWDYELPNWMEKLKMFQTANQIGVNTKMIWNGLIYKYVYIYMFENNSKDSESQLGSPNSGDAKWTGPLKGPAQSPTKRRLVSGQPAPTAFSGLFELLSLCTLQIKELIVVSLLSYSCNLILTLILEVNYPTEAGFTVVSRLIQTPLWFARVPSTTNLASQFLNTSIDSRGMLCTIMHFLCDHLESTILSWFS